MQTHTERGFKIYGEIEDSYQNKIRVQESSAACAARCWIFVKNHEGHSAYLHLGEMHAATAHLSVSQARELAKMLNAFADEFQHETAESV